MTTTDTEARLSALRRRLRQRAIYVSALPNIRYLTGFAGSAGHLLVTQGEAVLFTDDRYRTQAREQTDGIGIEIGRGDSLCAFAKAVRQRGLLRLAFEASRLGYADYNYLRRQVPACELVPVDSAVEGLRCRKSPAEIDALRRSAVLNSRAFDDACSRLEPGWTEARFAAELEFSMRRLGAEGRAFPTIVASGAHGALPHAEPRDQPIEPTSLVVVDQGAILEGYCSDMTRMIALGRPDTTRLALMDAVLEAQAAAVEVIRAGVECRTVDSRARSVLRKAVVRGVRLDTAFVHSTGHGLGLEIHEAPRVARRQRKRLQTGMVVTIEPGVYLEGFGGVRIEDVVAVTETGCEVLTPTPRELRIL